MIMSDDGLAFALAISALATFLFRVRDFIGPRIFGSFVLGRYHRPVTEERVFLFLDVLGSTRFAEQHGNFAIQSYLNAIFSELAFPVHRWGGSIDDYVGDMAIVSWTMGAGVRDAACLRCVFDFARMIEQDAERWAAQVGEVPRFRAALHCGSVVTAELGLERRKITYFGDAVNIASRLEHLAKEVGASVLASRDLLACLTVPNELELNDLGVRHIRGRVEPLGVVAIRARPLSFHPEASDNPCENPTSFGARATRRSIAIAVRNGSS
ncbi:adenylate/guanylate cyclase domain-containing protein [Enterovirga sp. CN4-39]|uniref:adenylate/guanylate cyclase domain-containing protein n=1 Tax=Enterovirga sp. CN4-39 TaxID=3400910 RepID=UPI003C10386D